LKNNTQSLYSGGQRPPERRAFEAQGVFGVNVQHGACRCRSANDSSAAVSAPQSLHTLSYVGYYLIHTLFRICYIIMKGTIIKPFLQPVLLSKILCGQTQCEKTIICNQTFKALLREREITMTICLLSSTATSTHANDEIQILGASH
jgi:hypothetical protein